MINKTLSNLPDIQSLVTIVSNICEKLGLNNVNLLNQGVIEAKEDSPLGHRQYTIACTLSQLNGKLESIKNLIKKHASLDDEIIIVSSHDKKISNYFKSWIKDELKTDRVNFWDESYLIDLIDKNLPEYWGHQDLFLKSFEDSFLNHLETNGELQKALKLDKKFEDLLNIFIEPKIYHYKEDHDTGRLIRARFKRENYLDGNNYFLSGDAGTGKTTLLKEIGKLAIEKNLNTLQKILPLRIKTSLIANSNYSINNAVDSEIVNLVGSDGFKKVYNDYKVLLLIDSIDEFETEKQINIFSELNDLVDTKDLNFVLATRNYENLTKECEICDHIHTSLSNFDLNQVQQYLMTFFKKDLKKSEDLWYNLQENKILERIPPTPLTISLVSILFEENGYEIPATITDVYDNFNTFLLGRLNVNSRLDFLKIDVKEKILQMYALKIIKSSNRKRLKRQDFINYVVEYFKEQSITIEKHIIPELIKGMTDGTGVLYIDELGFVTFQHDHFLEYYASREIFNDENRKDLENEIIDKFCEYNWQNTAIFYAGRTKNMMNFLDSLVERVQKYKILPDLLLSISGLGYILQSLWMTNSENRKKAVITALNLLIKADAELKLLAESKFPFFKGLKDTDIAVANLVWFFMHFNSLTLRDPLQLAFSQLHQDLKQLKHTQFERDRITKLYQLFCIAATLNTGRVKDITKLEQLFEEDKLLTIPLFVYLFDEAMDILEYENEAQLRKNYKIASKKRKYSTAIKFYLNNPSESLRYTTFEKLNPIKSVELFTEGKTDASIINHAFRILTMFDEPYWSTTAIENTLSSKAGGAQQLAKYLINLTEKIVTESDKNKIIIGLFDNDAKGYSEFNGLPNNFESINGILKKVEDMKIYALLLPIPDGDDYKAYHQQKQDFKFFEIEHYFPLKYLEDNNMTKETPIPKLYEITGKKQVFVDKILNIDEREIFLNFVTLFNEIDRICNKNINYIE